MIAYTLTRDLTQAECPWLDGPLAKGLVVYRYDGYTYGCISDDGTAVTLEPDVTPFFEVPTDALALQKGGAR